MLGFGKDVLQVREGTYRKAFSFPEGVADVVCREESMYVLAADGYLREIELEHGEHSENRAAAFAGAFFVFIILAIVAYQVAKCRFKKFERKSQSVHGH